MIGNRLISTDRKNCTVFLHWVGRPAAACWEATQQLMFECVLQFPSNLSHRAFSFLSRDFNATSSMITRFFLSLSKSSKKGIWVWTPVVNFEYSRVFGSQWTTVIVSNGGLWCMTNVLMMVLLPQFGLPNSRQRNGCGRSARFDSNLIGSSWNSLSSHGSGIIRWGSCFCNFSTLDSFIYIT